MSIETKLRSTASCMDQPPARRAPSLLVGMVALAVPLLVPRAAHALDYVFKTTTASAVYRLQIPLTAGQTYTFETANLVPQASCDPVMYMYRTSDYANARTNDNFQTGNLNARLTGTIPTGMGGTYDVIVRGKTPCTGDVKYNGSTHTARPFGGTYITLSSNVPTGLTRFETVLTQGGATDTRIWGMNSSDLVVKFDDDTGVGSASRFESTTARRILVASFDNATAGYTDFYVNPRNSGSTIRDTDGDGLADLLENELGTCRAAPCFGSGFDPKDTDRDGLEDAVEVFGLEVATEPNNPQFLPMWGANPRHKDVFVEWDWDPRISSTRPFTIDDVNEAVGWASGGTANDLLNPDGVPGYNLHIDCGISNLFDGSLTHGDWGGSNKNTAVNPDDWLNVWQSPANFANARRGIFRHAYMWTGGYGGADEPSNWLYWPASAANRNMGTFVHELGHSFGLKHHGHDSWGRGVGKPTYLSVMNYLYIGRNGFSPGTYSNVILNGAGSRETGVFGSSGVPSFVTQILQHAVIQSSSAVDWNRDGFFDGGAGVTVRNPVLWTPDTDTDSFIARQVSLVPEQSASLVNDTPAMVKFNGRLYLFYTTTRGLVYRSTPIGGIDVDGSCAGTNCTTWTGETLLSTTTSLGVLGVTAWVHGSALMVVWRASNGQVYIGTTAGASTAGVLNSWLQVANLGPMDATPAITSMYVSKPSYGATDLPVIFGSVNGIYKRWTGFGLAVGNPTVEELRTGTGHQMQGTISPTVVPWPQRGGVSHASNGTSCGVFVNQFLEPRFYCYDKASDEWDDLSSIVYQTIPMPQTQTKVGVAYHVLRNGTAAPLTNDVAYGQFWLTIAPPDMDKDGDGMPDRASTNPRLYMTRALATNRPPSATNSAMKLWRAGYYLPFELSAHHKTTVGLYEDESISATKAIVMNNLGELVFLPYGDGTFNENLRDGNDFQIIERGICRGVRADPNGSICGGPNVHGY